MPRSDDAVPAPASLVYVIGRVGQGVRRELGRRLEKWDLSVPEFTALSVLHRRPGLSNAQLARRSLITPQSMSQVVASLEERRLIRRRVDPHHGRILRAELTKLGRRRLAEADSIVDALQDELFAEVDAADREIVLRGLLACMGALSDGRVRRA